MSGHVATVSWRLEGDFRSGRYSRRHEWRFDGGAVVPGSASPANVPLPYSDASAVDPEEALIAATASCHMLWFIDFARRGGFVVSAYEDEASGTLGTDSEGRKAFTQIVLAPKIVFEGQAPTDEELAALHHHAHDNCFIANSLCCEVVIAPR